MMSCPLADRIQSDMVSAMKSRDERTLSVLRMLKAAMQMAETERGRDGELKDDDVQALVRRAVKQREEAAELYKSGSAPERAAEELEEAKILQGYLPAQLDDAALDGIVSDVIERMDAHGAKDMGRVMGSVMREVSGRADGKRVKDAVRKLLGD
jgi:uncharacterized protein YqeY